MDMDLFDGKKWVVCGSRICDVWRTRMRVGRMCDGARGEKGETTLTIKLVAQTANMMHETKRLK